MAVAFRLLSTRQLLQAAKALGWVQARVWGRPWRVERDINRVLGERFSANQRRAIARHSVEYRLQRRVAQFWPNRKDFCDPPSVVEGLQHLNAALALGRGVILTGPHFGYYDLAAAALACIGYPARTVVGNRSIGHDQKSRLGELIYTRLLQLPSPYRSGRGDIVAAGGAHAILHALQANEVVCTAIDAVARRSEAVQVFGVPVEFALEPARLSRMTGAPVLSGFFIDDGDSRLMRLEIGEPLPLQDDGGGAFSELARRYEQAILRHPHIMRWKVFRRRLMRMERMKRGRTSVEREEVRA
jgi:KDO2-lipid IV(A) lauroyltransferase